MVWYARFLGYNHCVSWYQYKMIKQFEVSKAKTIKVLPKPDRYSIIQNVLNTVQAGKFSCKRGIVLSSYT